MNEIRTQHDGSICGARPGSGPPFGRKVAGCPRCDELLAGAPVRELSDHRAYGIERAVKNQRYDAQRATEIRGHSRTCERCQSGAVCTFGDW